MKVNEVIEEDLDRRGFLKGIGSAAALGATSAKAANFQSNNKPIPTPPDDAINDVVKQKEDPLGAFADKNFDKNYLTPIDRSKVEQIATRIKNFVHKQPEPVKPKLYEPITGSKMETALHNFAVNLGIKGAELAAFMGQTAHETNNFKTIKEYGSGHKYEGRKDLGNTHKGDGEKYKGRGFIQITGRYNYTQAGKDLGLDLVNHPELVEKPDVAAKVTWWYWKNRVRPNVANFSDVKQVTKQINPGLKGLEKRAQATHSFKVAQQ